MRPLIASVCCSALALSPLAVTSAEDFDLDVGGEATELRIDIGFAFFDDAILAGQANFPTGGSVDLIEEEWDTAIEISGIWGHRIPFHGSERGWYLYWGLGPTIPYQTYDDGGAEAAHFGLMARYYLGLGYEFTRSFRLQVMPFVGGGLGIYSLDIGGASDDDFSTMGQFGGKAEVLFGNRGLTFGGGVSGVFNFASYDLDFSGTRFALDLDQDYAQLHLSLGYEF